MNDEDSQLLDNLISRVARGDRAAFEDLYVRTIGVVLGIAGGVLRDRAQAEEVAQEVYLEVWRAAPAFDPRLRASHLLLVMARRRAIDRVRAAQAARDRDHRFATSNYVRDYDESEESIEIRVRFVPVATAIRDLPVIHREVLFLAYVRGFSHSEIAHELGLPLGTVKTRLRNTLIRLRRELHPTTE